MSRVQFNGAALPGVAATPTEIRVRVPSRYFSVSPFVSEGGFRNGIYATSVIVLNGPVVTAIAPNPAAVGASVTVAGENFMPASSGSNDFLVALVSPSGARFNAQLLGRTRTQLQLGLSGVPRGAAGDGPRRPPEQARYLASAAAQRSYGWRPMSAPVTPPTAPPSTA